MVEKQDVQKAPQSQSGNRKLLLEIITLCDEGEFRQGQLDRVDEIRRLAKSYADDVSKTNSCFFSLVSGQFCGDLAELRSMQMENIKIMLQKLNKCLSYY